MDILDKAAWATHAQMSLIWTVSKLSVWDIGIPRIRLSSTILDQKCKYCWMKGTRKMIHLPNVLNSLSFCSIAKNWHIGEPVSGLAVVTPKLLWRNTVRSSIHQHIDAYEEIMIVKGIISSRAASNTFNACIIRRSSWVKGLKIMVLTCPFMASRIIGWLS